MNLYSISFIGTIEPTTKPDGSVWATNQTGTQPRAENLMAHDVEAAIAILRQDWPGQVHTITSAYLQCAVTFPPQPTTATMS